MNGLSQVPVQDHVELQSEDRKWQKWEIREGRDQQLEEAVHPFTSGRRACPSVDHPLKENPLFPLRLETSVGGGGTDERLHHDQLNTRPVACKNAQSPRRMPGW